MSILPKAIYRFNAMPNPILVAFFTELGEKPKICMTPKYRQIILRKILEVGVITIPDFNQIAKLQ